jgi:CheY-like chemotaxis protein/anti-sigma regulatory factor (Ser/Thr protein kinase)
MARVLLVEDSPTQAIEMTMLLEEGRHSVMHVENGRLGLEALAEYPLDVVVTDLEMPEVNGLELVQRMRADFAHIPAILVTSLGSEALAVEALQVGAAGYVPKREMQMLLNQTIADVLSVLQADESYSKLISTLTRNVFEFDMPNDPSLIAPLTGLLMQVSSGLQVFGGMELVRLGMATEHAVLNAMYRGNLELTRDQTPAVHSVIHEEATNDIVESRRSQSPYCDRRVYVEATATTEEVSIVVRDQGNGFDTSTLPEPGNADMLDTSGGRGLVLMTSFVDQITYNAKGNEVTLVKRRKFAGT